MLIIWLQFVFCSALIGLAGVRLIRYGDAIASRTGMTRSWIGIFLVASVTSLPELVTGLSSVTVAQAPDMAVGDVLGSCVFNLAILAAMDIGFRKAPLYSMADHGHLISAGFGVILLATTALILLLAQQHMLPTLAHISLGSPLILGLYVLAMRAIYLSQRRRSDQIEEAGASTPSLRAALTGYSLASMVVVACGVWLPMIGVELARVMGWSNSLVGTMFVALATSVPELATTLAALRIGAIDLAIGNLLGSNLFDVLILAVDDMAYIPGALYADISPLHASTALIACIMSGAVVIGLAYRPTRRVRHIGSWASLALVLLYLLNGLLQYLHNA
jgi:cation:H+ antiporter